MDITTLGLQDPTQTFQKWYGVTQPLRDMRAQEKQDAIDQSKMAILQQNADLERQKMEAEAARQAELNAAFQEVQKNDTAENRKKFVMLHSGPDAEKMSTALNSLDQQTRENMALGVGQVLSAIQNGQPQIGFDILSKQAEGYRASGQEDKAKQTEAIIEAGKLNPNFVVDYYKGILPFFPEGQKVYDQLNENLAAPGDRALTEADTRLKNADAALKEIEAGLKKTGAVTPEKRFEQEEKLRKDYQTRTGVYNELGSTFDNLTASAASGTAAGDIALITSFMKMLDPGSVVRETEFAKAQDTGGLFVQLQGMLEKAKSGRLFPDSPEGKKQRQDYVDLAGKYYKSAEKKKDSDFKLIERVANGYGLDMAKIVPDEVERGAPSLTGVPATTGTPAAKPAATTPQKKVTVDF